MYSPSRHYNATYRSSVVPMYIRSCYIGRPRHMSLTSQTGSRRASACQHVHTGVSITPHPIRPVYLTKHTCVFVGFEEVSSATSLGQRIPVTFVLP
ncbi:hypothetical protein VTJ04DRAFT_862 [Mycothermus thermophilus]|uniref:uncharacterized protein n=1 Tax=Humicola insolens TaxID=85995 RepID=UPI003742DC1D